MLNKVTVVDSYTLPRSEEMFKILNGATLFSTTNINSECHLANKAESHV